ncbi:MAG TPA: hypothetical protein VF058_08945 [Actinomycetota bacterium]
MPLVFIHGVGTREGPGFEDAVDARDAMFRRFMLARTVTDPSAVTITNPYWGRHGARLAWDHASLPGSPVEALGPEDEDLAVLSAPILEDRPPSGAPLLATARRSLEEAVDLLWAAAAEISAGASDELARMAARAVDYARHEPDLGWLDEVQTDEEFLEELERRVEAWTGDEAAPSGEPEPAYEALGAAESWARIGEAADRIKGFVGRLAGRAVVEVARAPAHRSTALFLGDILVYLRQRGMAAAPGPIVVEVADALDAARQAVTAEDPRLIVVAHSMGGNIAYDLLTHFRPDLEVDVLVTVGSQVAFFEELKLFAESDEAVPKSAGDRAPKPPNVSRWINIFDRNDVLGFVAEGVFSEVEDYEYSTGKGVLFAHTTYFVRPSFHDRLGERVAGPAA